MSKYLFDVKSLEMITDEQLNLEYVKILYNKENLHQLNRDIEYAFDGVADKIYWSCNNEQSYEKLKEMETKAPEYLGILYKELIKLLSSAKGPIQDLDKNKCWPLKIGCCEKKQEGYVSDFTY